MHRIVYPGNKAQKNLIPHIINIIPPHKMYVELFLGSGGVSRHLNLPSIAYGVEKNNCVISTFKNVYPSGMVVINDCAISWLKNKLPALVDKYGSMVHEDIFIYLDPPYIKSSRRSMVDIYKYEMTDKDHVDLLKSILTTTAIRVRVAISGYDNPLYNKMLKGWNKKYMKVCVHGKVATEVVWFNYPVPESLHQYNYIGKNRTERQRIKRKISRWVERLKRLPGPERNAILDHLKLKTTTLQNSQK